MKSETNRELTASTPTCWQREAPCACLRIESSAREAHVFPYPQLVTASVTRADDFETVRLSFATHNVEITGRNLRPLLLTVQDFAVKWVRVIPDRYQRMAGAKNGIVVSVRIEEAN